MAAKMVCQGALCRCDQGATPTPLTVTSQTIVTVENMPAATVMDNVPIANIAPFGICQQLTKAASGVPTPCVPAPTGPWSPASEINSIMGFKVLMANSKLACGVGGTITIQQPNCNLNYELS